MCKKEEGNSVQGQIYSSIVIDNGPTTIKCNKIYCVTTYSKMKRISFCKVLQQQLQRQVNEEKRIPIPECFFRIYTVPWTLDIKLRF